MATTTTNPFDPMALANGTSTLTMRASALGLSTDLVQAGVVFNDATRLLDGGLWNQPADSRNQQNYASMYTTDIHAVLIDISAVLADPATATAGGVAYTPSATDISTLTAIQSQLQTLLTDAPNAVGHSAAAVQAQQSLHTVQSEILSEVANDPGLAAAINQVQYTSGTGATNVAFQALPPGADHAATLAAATAPGASLATIGQVFNAASDLAVGGLNHIGMGPSATRRARLDRLFFITQRIPVSAAGGNRSLQILLRKLSEVVRGSIFALLRFIAARRFVVMVV